MTQTIPSNTFGVAKWIVDPVASQGTHTTITGALASASIGDTIAIRPATYIEDPNLKAGVNLVAWPILEYRADATASQVIIKGKMTATFTGTMCISGIRLQTNADFFLVVSGTNDTQVNLSNCYLDCLNNTGISYTNSNAGSYVAVFNSTGDLGTTGVTYFSASSAGTLRFEYFTGENSGSSVTVNSRSGGMTFLYYSIFDCSITLSDSAQSAFKYSEFNPAVVGNNTALTLTDTSSNLSTLCTFSSGSASAISVGAGTACDLKGGIVESLNTNAITGGGNLTYQGIDFRASATVNVTTQAGGTMKGGTFQAPSTGFLGELFTANATAVAVNNATSTTITSITLPAGIYDLEGSISSQPTGGAGIMGGIALGISTTTNTLPSTFGVGYNQMRIPGITLGAMTAPKIRATPTTSTTYYLVAFLDYTSTTCPTAGIISATRVG